MDIVVEWARNKENNLFVHVLLVDAKVHSVHKNIYSLSTLPKQIARVKLPTLK